MKRRDLVKLLESNGWYYVRDEVGMIFIQTA